MGGSRIFHVNLDVSDLDRSIEFYGLLGFGIVRRERIDLEAVRATLARLGETEAVAVEFALVRLGDDPTATCVDPDGTVVEYVHHRPDPQGR